MSIAEPTSEVNGERKPNVLPNPLPCGCGVKAQQDLENAIETGHSLRVPWKNYHVVHCPMHAAAPRLYAAAKFALESLEALESLTSEWIKGSRRADSIALLRAALRAAGGAA